MKCVFVCKHGEYRSSMAARLADRLANERGLTIQTDYFGVKQDLSREERLNILQDADRVYVMEEGMRFDIEKVLGYQGEVICLNVPDRRHIPEEDMARALKNNIREFV